MSRKKKGGVQIKDLKINLDENRVGTIQFSNENGKTNRECTRKEFDYCAYNTNILSIIGEFSFQHRFFYERSFRCVLREIVQRLFRNNDIYTFYDYFSNVIPNFRLTSVISILKVFLSKKMHGLMCQT